MSRAPRPDVVRRQRLGLILLAAVMALALQRLPAVTGTLIELGLGGFFHRPVTVAAVRFHLSPLEAEILDLRVGGATPDAPPFLEIPRVVAVPRLAPILSQRLEIEELRLERLHLQIHAYPEGGDDIPRMGGGGGGGLQFQLGRLRISDGTFTLDHRRVPLDLDLPDFRGGLGRRAGLLSGNLSFGPGRMRFGDAEAFPVGTDLELVVRGSRLDVPRGRLWTERIQLEYSGEVRLSRRPEGDFELHGRIDLDELDTHVMRTGFGIRGEAAWEGELHFVGSQLVIEGDMDGEAGEFDGFPVPRYRSHVRWGDGHVVFTGLDVETMGGRGRLDIDLAPRDQTSTMRGRVEAVDAESLTRLVLGFGEAGFSGRATGPFDVNWQRGHFDRLTGTLSADVVRAPGGVPLEGRFAWHAEAGNHFIDTADFRTDATRLQLEGTIDLERRNALSLEAESDDLTATDGELARIRRGLGTADAIRMGLGGRGRFSGRWEGTTDVPVFSGRLRASETSWLGVTWGDADWRGRVTPTEVVTQSLAVERGASALQLSGRSETGTWGEQDGVDLLVSFERWPARDFLQVFSWDVAFDGDLSGEARVRGRRSVPEGFVRLTAPAGSYYGVPWAELAAESLFGGSVAAISRGRATIGGGPVDFRGSLTDTGVWDGAVRADDVDLESMGVLPEGVPLSARVHAALTLEGSLERPRLTGELGLAGARLGAEELGDVEGTVRGDGDGLVHVAARSDPRLGLALQGRVESLPPWRGWLQLDASASRLDPYLRAAFPRWPGALELTARGALSVSGPLLEPAALDIALDLESLDVGLPEYAVRAPTPIVGRTVDGRFRLDAFRLAGEGSDLEVTGGIALASAELEARVAGEADLRILSALEPRLRGRGTARLTADLTGTARAPRIAGELNLQDAALRLRGVPHGLEDVHGRIRFTEAAAEISELVGTLGGGEVRLEGQAGLGGAGLASLDLEARGRSISLRWPEGLRSRLDAELRIFGDGERQWVTGTVDVRRAEWTRRYDLASELLSGERAAWGPEPTLSEGVRLDVRVRAPGTLRIDNNLATLQARADLRLQGTAAAPVLVGRAELDRGRVYFQGNTYVIRRGTIDFANAQRTIPLFDVEAETRVRSYRVTLRLNGTLERAVPTLTSDPPLSPIQILNLLAGADESAVASLAQAQAEEARLAAAGAATLAASRITEEVGLERGAERLLGLNRFSIDPSVLKGDFSNPTARLTLGKRITPDLNVQYSQDLSSDAERQFTLEYTLSDRLSLLLTQSEPGGFGFDLRLRQSR